MNARRIKVSDCPLLEHDHCREGIINPAQLHARLDVPEHAVLSFCQEGVERVAAQPRTRIIKQLRSEMGRHPVYLCRVGGRPLVLANPRVGAPLAAAMLEALIAVGCRKFIVCGGAGVLDGTIPPGEFLVPRQALRDEGTSYHYLPASRFVSAGARAVASLRRTLSAEGVSYRLTRAWTIDAFYRETPRKIAARLAEGCQCVEMELAALFAVARFRKVQLAGLLYAADDVSGKAWQRRHWMKGDAACRERLMALAIKACLAM